MRLLPASLKGLVSRMADITGLLSMCRRAGKLVGGMDEVKGSCQRGEARAVLITRDFSENSFREITRTAEKYRVPTVIIDMSMDDVGGSVGKRFGVMAVCDAGFAKAVEKKIAQ